MLYSITKNANRSFLAIHKYSSYPHNTIELLNRDRDPSSTHTYVVVYSVFRYYIELIKLLALLRHLASDGGSRMENLLDCSIRINF